jgi:hypothetical protein
MSPEILPTPEPDALDETDCLSAIFKELLFQEI